MLPSIIYLQGIYTISFFFHLGLYSLLKKNFVFYCQFNYLTVTLKGEETNFCITCAQSTILTKQNKQNLGHYLFKFKYLWDKGK